MPSHYPNRFQCALLYIAQVVTEGHGEVLGLNQSDLPPGVGHVNPGGTVLPGPAVVPGVHLVPDVFRLQSSQLPSECRQIQNGGFLITIKYHKVQKGIIIIVVQRP